jgi:hypothetical protein
MSRRESLFPGIRYKSVSGRGPRRDIGILCRLDRPLSRAAHALVNFLKAEPHP